VKAQKKKAVLRVRVPVDVLRAVQHLAIDHGLRLADAVTTALRAHVCGASERRDDLDNAGSSPGADGAEGAALLLASGVTRGAPAAAPDGER
jgi:hypothetical protein